MTPYYDEDGITIYHGDCRELIEPWLGGQILITDPPYGIEYKSGQLGALSGIQGDSDTSLRDWVLSLWPHQRPWAVFGSWKRPKPDDIRGVLVWEKGDHVGMGDLRFPWRPNWEEIYIGGDGWDGHRGSSVIRCNAPVSWNTTTAAPRRHPHEKPVSLITELLNKAPDGIVVDPFMGSGTTLRAARDLGMEAIGVEIDERYCEVAAKRLAQGVLSFD